MVKILETEKGLVLEVHVKPRSKEFRIAVEGEEVVIHCLEEPVGGRVNAELVKRLSRLLGKRVELLSGHTSRQKRLLIKDACKSEVECVLTGE